jgi:hypothetical protein
MEDVPGFCAELDVLTQLTGFKLTRGMLCTMKRKPLPKASDICKDKSRIVILDKVMNPTNVGAIIRSAAALGMDAVLLTPGCSDPLYRRAARVSMGTVFQIDWAFLSDDSLEEVRALGFKTVAMALKDDSLSIDDSRLQKEEKLAVECGYWHLYRYNPLLEGTEKNPFSLDSKEPDWTKFQDFLKGEVRFASLQKLFPERAAELLSKTEEFAKVRYENYKRLAGK